MSGNPFEINTADFTSPCEVCQKNWQSMKDQAVRSKIYQEIGPESNDYARVELFSWRIPKDGCTECADVLANMQKVKPEHYTCSYEPNGMIKAVCTPQAAYFATRDTAYFNHMFSLELRCRMNYRQITIDQNETPIHQRFHD